MTSSQPTGYPESTQPLYPNPATTQYYEPPPPYDTNQLIRSPGLQPSAPQFPEKQPIPQQEPQDGGAVSSAAPIMPIEHRAEAVRGGIVEDLIKLLLCVLLPPAAILLHSGPKWKRHFLANIVLCFVAWLPGIIHAVWYCFYNSEAPR